MVWTGINLVEVVLSSLDDAGMPLETSTGPQTWSSRGQARWSWCSPPRMAVSPSTTPSTTLMGQVGCFCKLLLCRGKGPYRQRELCWCSSQRMSSLGMTEDRRGRESQQEIAESA